MNSQKLLIKNGRLIDPSQNFEGIADLLIENGKISQILPPEVSCGQKEGVPVIDAGGLVVSPGFIDIHMHEDPLDADGHIDPCIFPAMLRMGVTSVLAGNCGDNVCHPARYLDLVDREGAAVNVAMLAGHSWFRVQAGVTDKYAPAAAWQIQQMTDAMSDALEQGCLGLSFGLRYVPGTTTEEFLQAASGAAGPHALISAHVRDDAAFIFESVGEFVRAGYAFHVPLQISHIGSMGGFGQMAQLLDQIDQYRSDGLDVAADCYPYDAFSTSIGASTYDDGWMERYGCDYSAIEMCEGPWKGQRCTREIFAQMRKEMPDALTVCHVMRPDEIRTAYQRSYVCVASDGILSHGQGHPRASGTFPRFLAKYVRDWKNLSLMEGLARMTSLPASRMGLSHKGNLRIGSDADLVIFDPETILDRASFHQPMTPPDGIFYVLLGGQIAVQKSLVVNDRLGRAIRRHS